LFGSAGVKGPSVFRAYDKTSGEIVWETQLPAGTTGGPVSYVANGKQFIVVPVGGKDAGTSWIALGLK
jgi:quinoprotein glucose dehydrogenase